MPRRLPERNRTQMKRPRRFSKRQRSYQLSFQEGAPVKEGEEVEVVIDDIGSRGDGTARIQGFLIFVPGAKIGERLKVKISSVSKGFALAEKINEMEGEN